MKTLLKRILFGSGNGLKTIRFGIAKGIKMQIDPANKAQRILGLDEFEIHSYFKSFARKCNTFVDIGASDGFYSLIYRKHNPAGSIFSCEGQSRFEAEQRENFGVNGYDHGKNFFYTSKFIGSHNEGNFITVDTLLQNNAVNDVFLKIDIDGGEVEALKGASGTLKNKNCGLIIETHSLQLENDCISILQSMNYACEIIKNAAVRRLLPEQREIEHNRWLVATKR
jgi:hypothetical protein